MLEHVPDPESTVRACSRLVRPGSGVLSTINRNPKSFLLAIVGAEYVLACCRVASGLKLFARRSSHRRRAWQPGGRRDERMTYNPIWRYRLDPRDVDVNYLAAFRRSA